MRHKNLDLLLVLSIAVGNVAWVLLSTYRYPNLASFTVISTILALPLVFITPGYAIIETLFPHRALETLQRWTFILAVSLALAILSGFLLNQFPAGLRPLPWATWLALITAFFTLLASLRRGSPLAPVPPAGAGQPRSTRVRISEIALLGIATLVIVLSVVYSVLGAQRQPHPGFTNLWIVPTTQAGNTCAVSVGMQSFERAPLTYRVVITTNNVQTASWDRISLAPDQQWQQTKILPVGNTVPALVVLVQVYRLDQPQTVYRHVDVTLYVTTPQGSTVKHCSYQ